MEPFLSTVEEYGCQKLILESRGPADDKRDRVLLDTLRSKRQVDVLRLDHRRGPEEPLLWIPDALCGAVASARIGDRRWWEVIQDQIHVTEIDARPQV